MICQLDQPKKSLQQILFIFIYYIYVVENSEEPQLKNLSIFLEFKLLISRVPRRLFHPSEEQQVCKNKFHFHWHVFWGRIFWLSKT